MNQIKILIAIAILVFPFKSWAENYPDDLEIVSYEYSTFTGDGLSLATIKVFEIRNVGKSAIWLRFFDKPCEKFQIKDIYKEFFGPTNRLYQYSQEINYKVLGYTGDFYKVLFPEQIFKYIFLFPQNGYIKNTDMTKSNVINYFLAFNSEDVYSLNSSLGPLLNEVDKNNPVIFFPYNEYVNIFAN